MITLESCTNSRSLPSLGLLCSLKALTIREMTELKIIGFEIYRDGCSKPFKSLETILGIARIGALGYCWKK